MMLRVQCEHGQFDDHSVPTMGVPVFCPGGRTVHIDDDVLRTAARPVVAARKYMDDANSARLAVVRALLAAVDDKSTT